MAVRDASSDFASDIADAERAADDRYDFVAGAERAPDDRRDFVAGAELATDDEIAAMLPGMDPGPVAMMLLRSIDIASVSESNRVLVVQAWERQAAWLNAQSQKALVAVVGKKAVSKDDWVREEVACALGLSARAAQNRIHAARTLTALLPNTLALLDAGAISIRHALAFVDECRDLEAATITAVEARVLARASHQTAAAFRRSIQRAILALEPERAELAHAEAAAQRSVRFIPEPDGMASVVATLPAPDARALFLAIDALARGAATAAKAKGVTDPRGIDARRADALIAIAWAALADRRLPRDHGRPVEVHFVVDLATLAGLANHPAELVGYGAIPAGLVQSFAFDAKWRRLVVDPVDGHLLDYGRRTYRPPKRLRDYVDARDLYCFFPGCGRPASRCDFDHELAWSAGGKTSASNGRDLCRRHHRGRTKGDWRLVGRANGSCTWTSPAGHTYVVPARNPLDPD
jgi:hypothetical protein